MRRFALAWLAALWVSGCARPERTGSQPAPSATHGAERIGTAQQQCRRILLRAWSSIQPGLEKLRLERSAQQKARYLGELGAPFLAACLELPASVKSCLDRAPNPVIAAHECAAASGASLPEFPSFA